MTDACPAVTCDTSSIARRYVQSAIGNSLERYKATANHAGRSATSPMQQGGTPPQVGRVVGAFQLDSSQAPLPPAIGRHAGQRAVSILPPNESQPLVLRDARESPGLGPDMDNLGSTTSTPAELGLNAYASVTRMHRMASGASFTRGGTLGMGLSASRQSIGDLSHGQMLNLEDISRCGSLAASRHQSVRHCGLSCIVDDTLYLGSHRDVCDLEHIREGNVRAFLCVAREVTGPLPNFVRDQDLATQAVVFKHMQLADNSTTTLLDHIPEVFAFIDENAAAGRPVALFCQQGKSRSVSFALAYLMREHAIDAEEALRHLQSFYPKAEPNFYFLNQLRALELTSLPPKPQRRQPRKFGANGAPSSSPPSPSVATPAPSPETFKASPGVAELFKATSGLSGMHRTPTPSYLKEDLSNAGIDVPWVEVHDDDDNFLSSHTGDPRLATAPLSAQPNAANA